MRALKKEVVRGNLNGKSSTFTVELVEVHDGFEVNYGDNKGWGIGYKNFEKCDNFDDAIQSYLELTKLIKI